MIMPLGECEDRATPQERFNEVFKTYNEKEKKTQKKKSSQPTENIVLQTLKKDLNLVKDVDVDETILQNTYDPVPSSPRYTKNKRREREITEKINNKKSLGEVETSKTKNKSRRDLPPLPSHDDNSYIEKETTVTKSETVFDPESIGEGTERKRESKKGKRKDKTGSQLESQVDETDDKLLHDYQQQIARVADRALKKDDKEEGSRIVPQKLNNDFGKKKKKKLKSVNTESDVGDQLEAVAQESEMEHETGSLRKKKKKKKHIVKENCEVEAEVPQRPTFDDSLVLGVYIHRTDRLRTDLMISHPMVKIHVVDETTGQYVKKEDCHRPVSSFYEQENVDHILPIMTQPFDFKKNKCIIPEWQEQIIFNERFGYFVQQDEESPRVVLFFEILDFVTMEEAKVNVAVDTHERGFRKIAWGFLKLVGTNGVMNIESKVRLQLFCPPHSAKKQPKTIEVVEWWRKHPRIKYASTLYVTVKGIKLPEHVDPSMRSMMALQEERGSTSYSDLQNEATKRNRIQPMESKPPALTWCRLPGQVCRIPNKPVLAFRGGQIGFVTVRFSHSGTILAAACADRDAFPVVVYEIPSGKVLAAFSGHLKIVYDLSWSRDDQTLVSSSSDGTVREWNVEGLLSTAQKVLPHPCFVYCAQYHPTAQNLVLTGGYDSLVRVWRLDVSDVNGELLQGLEGHCSFVNSVCFDSEGSRMFSADNTGLIIVWKTFVDDSRKQQQPCHLWCMERRIDEMDLSGIPISMLQLHPNGRCLLIHAKDSVLRMMDLRILVVKKYTGATNYRERIYSTFTPCGNFIFSGSEDGMAYVWNTDTGDQVAVYSELCYSTALHGVSFHPFENMVAFCAYGQSQPIHIYLYDRKVNQLELHSLKTGSRSASADVKTARNTPDTPGLMDASAVSAMDQFSQATRLALRLQSVKEQLDSVLEPHHPSLSRFPNELDKSKTFTLDAGTGLISSKPPLPLRLSQLKLQPSSSVMEQLLPQAALSSQHRWFSPIDQPVGGSSSLRLQTTSDAILSGLQEETVSTPIQQTVVALYDYDANRSDELTVKRGDVIQVLYKDNDNWWFGCLENGLQGYFLASYVVDHSDFQKDVTQAADAHTVFSGENVERATPTRVSAAITTSGDLCFLSEPTLSDTEPELRSSKTRRKKKVKKAGVLETSTPTTLSNVSGLSSSGGGKPWARPLPKRPVGRPDRAFEPNK